MIKSPLRMTHAAPFTLRRQTVLMEPNLDDPLEAGGVLNPASARSRDGQLYLFPRLVAKGNYSRIGIARVQFNPSGDPVGVERIGLALEPTETYEKNPVTGGGCEDPRITYIDEIERYVMTYTAFSAAGPRIALAVSSDLLTWTRLGLAHFSPMGAIDLNSVDNKDALLFPSLIADPRTGRPSIAMIHRPTFIGSPTYSSMDRWWDLPAKLGKADNDSQPPARQLKHPSVWISYCQVAGGLDAASVFQSHHQVLQSHHRLLSPARSWERVKVGGGAPPLLTAHGWMLIYHGVARRRGHFRYSAGVVVLNERNPEQIVYRTRQPVLSPGAEDQLGVVPDVVFPTAVDERSDIGCPERVDVYYGMADSRIGVATLRLPHLLELQPGGRRFGLRWPRTPNANAHKERLAT